MDFSAGTRTGVPDEWFFLPGCVTEPGTVRYTGRKGGYGNVVIIQHGQTYKTLYAHISKFRKGIRSGG